MPYSNAAKVHSSSGEREIMSSALPPGNSKNISDGGSPDNQKENFEKKTPSSSDHHGDNDQALTESLKVFVSSGEMNVEGFSELGTKTHVGDSSGESLKEKGKSPVYENNGIKWKTLEKENKAKPTMPSRIKNSLNEELKISSEQEIPAANNSSNSSDKLEESLQSNTSSKDDKINGNFRKDAHFLLRRNSHAYDGSISSIDKERRKQIPRKYLDLSRRTFGRRTSSSIIGKVTSRKGVQQEERDFSLVSDDFQSALYWMESENDAPSISKSKDTKQFVNFRFSEKDDKVKIIRKVDELKSELLEYFHRTAIAEGDSRLGHITNFEGKIPPKQFRSSSLIPLSKQPNSSVLNPHHGGTCCHNACGHIPETTTGHLLHMKRCHSLHQEPQNLQSNYKKPQTVKRHCRPVSGGAPFVICYRCYKLLQLPADFLVSTKRVHKLRCGSCYEVLKYYFRSRTRSMPWTPAEARHPPSEENDEVLDGEIRVPVSNDLARGDRVSYSEEYDISLGKSYSYEVEPSRCFAREDAIVEEDESRKKYGSSQLHKLMGYSSARYLLFENLSPGEGHRIEQDR